jgi:hypothetical protein
MRWMTNISNSDVVNTMTNLKNSRPKRCFVVGRPKANPPDTIEDLERMGHVGVYEIVPEVYEVVPETETKAS